MKHLKIILIALIFTSCNHVRNSTELKAVEKNKINFDTELKLIEKLRSEFCLAIKEGRYQDIELVLSCSFTCEFRILRPNFVIFSSRSSGYVAKK